MTDYKENAQTYNMNVLIINTVPVRIKTNSPKFARQWLQRQLAPILLQHPPGTQLKVEIADIGTTEECENDAEVYGEVDGNVIVIFEQVKNEIF